MNPADRDAIMSKFLDMISGTYHPDNPPAVVICVAIRQERGTMFEGFSNIDHQAAQTLLGHAQQCLFAVPMHEIERQKGPSQ